MAIIVSEVNEDIRFLLSGLSTSTMSDAILDKIIQKNIDLIGDTDENKCLVTYQSLLNTLNYLIIGQVTNGIGITQGNIKKRKEKIAGREIEIESFDSSTTNSISTYESLYDMFLEDPTLVCSSLAYLVSTQPTVIIGGVSQSQYNKVKSNPDSRNGWSSTKRCGSLSRRGRC